MTTYSWLVLGAVACGGEAPPPPRTLVGPLAPWVDPRLRSGADCVVHAQAGFANGPPPYRACEVRERGRAVAAYIVASDSTVVSTYVSALILPTQRAAAIAAESAAVAARLGPGCRCAVAIAWQRDGWYVVARWLATTNVERDYERKPWALSRIGGLGRVPDAWRPQSGPAPG